MNPEVDITPEAARQAFHVHVVDKAQRARLRYGPEFTGDAIRRMLGDAEVVRHPTELLFDAGALQPHEFAFAKPIGFHASDGCCLCVHPHFELRPETWAALVGYHVPVINYGALADDETCSLYASTLLDVETQAYDRMLGELADEAGLAVRTVRG